MRPPCRDRQGPPRGLRDLESPTRSVGAPELFRRARWRYQACGRGALEVHHLVKRAQGGSDFELDRLVALCPPCHVRTDASDTRGRLIIRRHDAVPIRAPPDQARRPDGTDRSWRRPWGLLPGQAGSAPRSETLAYTEPFEQQGLDPPDVARRVTQGQPPSAGRTRTRVRRTVRPSSSARLGLAMTNRAPWRAVTSTKSAW